MLHEERLRSALAALDGVLADRGLSAHIAVVGGAAFLLRERGRRRTADVDVVAVSTGQDPLRETHELPRGLQDAARDVAHVMDLDADWLNAGALAVVSHLLPDGYQQRLRTESFGNNLLVSVLAREDLIRLKLFAGADEGPGSPHLSDLLEADLSRGELRGAAQWVRGHLPGDSHPELDEVVEFLSARLP